MTVVVLDTAAVLFWTLDPGHMNEAGNRAVAAADRLVVSSMSIWEIALKASRGRLTLPLPVDDYVAKLKQTKGVEVVAVDDLVFLRTVALHWDHRDPADRTIVATALERDCPLISSDRVIADFYPKTVW